MCANRLGTSSYINEPTLSLEQRRDELLRQFKTLPMDDRRRAEKAQLIVRIEDEMAARRIDHGDA